MLQKLKMLMLAMLIFGPSSMLVSCNTPKERVVYQSVSKAEVKELQPKLVLPDVVTDPVAVPTFMQAPKSK